MQAVQHVRRLWASITVHGKPDTFRANLCIRAVQDPASILSGKPLNWTARVYAGSGGQCGTRKTPGVGKRVQMSAVGMNPAAQIAAGSGHFGGGICIKKRSCLAHSLILCVLNAKALKPGRIVRCMKRSALHGLTGNTVLFDQVEDTAA